jgi:hypothetical protein
MRGIFRLALPLVVLVQPASADIAVRESQGRVDVAASAAPLADVLERLARQTGMKVVYEGPAPRQLVTLSLVGRSPAEAVTSILEGQGLNYALILDATATRVEKLLVTGASTSSGASSASSSRPGANPPGRRFTPSEPEPEPEEPAPEETPPPPPDPASPPTPAPEKVLPANPQPSPNAPAGPAGMSPGLNASPPLSRVLPAFPVPPGFPTPPPPQPTPTPPPSATPP